MIAPTRIFRHVLPLAVLTIGVLVAGCSSSAFTPTVAEADLKRTAAYPGVAPPLETLVWKFEAPGRRGDEYGRIKSAPAVDDSTVYVGSFDGHLYALDRSSGEQMWALDTRASIEHAPAVADSMVFFGSGGTLHAVDVVAAEETWRYEEGISASHPIVHDRMVVFGDRDGHVYALDQSTGSEQWRFDAGSQVRHAPALSNGRLYVINGDAELFSLSLDSGDVAWQVRPEVETGPVGSPVVSEGTVYAGTMDGRLYAVDENTGEEQWADSLAVPIHRSPTVYDGVVYVRTYCDGRTCVHALEADTGTRVWHSEFDLEPVVTALASAGGVLYIGGAEGLYAVDTETGEKIGAFSVEEGVGSTSVIRDGRLYFASGRYLHVVK